jgi:uncharacterized surface protein with fasciclin (FAS1) repeats
MGAKDPDKAISVDHDQAMRFFKYSVLILAILLTLRVVFDGYSFYVARRAIDAELDASKGVSSLEYLKALRRRRMALTLETLETRCAERNEIAFFRVFSVEKENKLSDYFKQTMDIKSTLIDEINRLGPGYIDTKTAVSFINKATFTVSEFKEHYLSTTPTANKNDQKYKDLMEQVDNDLRKYETLVLASKELQSLVKEAEEEAQFGWHLNAVNTLEKRLSRLKEERASDTHGDLDDIMARYGAWTDALTGGFSNSALIEEMNLEVRKDDMGTLSDVKCDIFKEFYEEVNNKVLTLNPPNWTFSLWYNRQLSAFFDQPSPAQTLFVTLFLGALGGLTVNVLRLSQLGWWRGQNDPLWGEIVVSPFLGALAAFSIYLVGNVGLLLTSDFRATQNGGSPLSASFIGFLGFLSGFLYDAAFGKVRQVGTRFFAGDTSTDLAQTALPDDRSFAEALRIANASLAAGLVIKYGIGTKLASENQFTFLVPSDQAMGRLPLKTWMELNDEKGDAFDRWYRHHHSASRVIKRDLSGADATAQSRRLEVDDGTAFTIALDGDELIIDNTKAIVAAISWKKGIIHVLQDEIS